METQTEKRLNVTLLPPSEKHSTIFQWFDALKEGDSFILHNDHDPKPLYYQLLSQRGEIFSWEYLQQGPAVFEIKITKNTAGAASMTSSDTAVEQKLDVTKLPPYQKHPTIFQWFDNLKEGESFILHNDHDPKPLYYQLIGERGKIFSWDYLEQGPEVFEIRIKKLKATDEQSANGKKLDVTQLPPPLKHPTIFKWFDSLKEGENFIIHNDHDPKPLYYQLLGERGKIFTWEYLQQGPGIFEIKITKTNTQEKEETVGSIAAKDYRKSEVFKRLGIDFCCGGEKTLREAAEQAGITEAELRKALEEVDTAQASGPNHDYDKWDLDFLADYIRQTHHRYVRDNAEVLTGIAAKVANAHGSRHPELNELAPRVENMLNQFMEHMDKEEKIFADIKRMVEAKRTNNRDGINAGMVSQPIIDLEAEHEETGDDLRYFRKLTNNYTLPSDACNSYTYLYEKLQEFENDTFRHVHLENNILFPKAVELEDKLS